RKYLPPLYLGLLGGHRFVAEFFRGDAPGAEVISGLRFYQTVCVFMLAVSLGMLVVLRFGKKGVPVAVVALLDV
ncbi:MAG: hypothetical protein GY758_22150, partial [Fuerstiella sp.]|nr:hypothetical protein [Fuerstiella sp.]